MVLEASSRPGGVVGTELFQGALLERGADTLVTHKPAAIELCRRLGLGEKLVAAPAGKTEILQSGALHPVPDGFALLAPTRPEALVGSELLSEAGLRRALAEPGVEKRSAHREDESVGAFVRRRFGDELLERVVEPIVGAIHLADVDRLSLCSTFSRFAALEAEHGSVSAGLAAAGRAAGGGPAAVTLKDGLGGLVDALVGRLAPESLRTNRRAEVIGRTGSGFVIRVAGGQSLTADGVLLAVPPVAAARLVRGLDPEIAGELETIRSADAATVHVAWPASAVGDRAIRSLGFFVPRSAGLALVAATFVHAKFPERVPDGLFLVRAFFGGAARDEVASKPDGELAETAVREISGLLGVERAPLWTHVVRHGAALPQPEVGHLEKAARLRARVAGLGGLEAAGGPVGAYGLPDTIAAAEAAAFRLLGALA